MDLNNVLEQAKAGISAIKEKLNGWNSILKPTNDRDDANPYNREYTDQFDLNQYLQLVNKLDESINEEYGTKTQKILNEFEEINFAIKERDCWFAEPEINKPSLVHKALHRGYFNSNFTIKKIEARFDSYPAYTDNNNFILERNFGTLLTYGIVRWPWMDKIVFARNWAEQLCLSKMITRTEGLKNKLLNNSSNDLIKEIIALLEPFLPYKNKIVICILDSFKEYVASQLKQSEVLKQEINKHYLLMCDLERKSIDKDNLIHSNSQNNEAYSNLNRSFARS